MENTKIYLIVALSALAVALIILPGFKNSIAFKIEDKCGRFVNLVSHTIADEQACETRCASQCTSYGRDFKKIEFEKIYNGCNSCTCHCR